jgi:hypothetical protein
VAKKVGKKAKIRKKKPAARGKDSREQKLKRTRRRLRGPQSVEPLVAPGPEGLGAEAAGQSGDTEGLSREEDVDSESVEELTEEGQDYEAEIVKGVEDAPEPDEGRAARVRTSHYIPPEER